ncbi:MAG: carboxypeptidase-like regulatory domain-containing protein [Terriglobia bacterium]
MLWFYARHDLRWLIPSRAIVIFFRALFLFTLTSLTVLPLFSQGRTVRVEGTVRTEAGQIPDVGVIVRIETEDGELAAQSPASSSGAFLFEDVVKKVCRLIVTADGFETSVQTLDLTQTGNTDVVSVNLIPAQKTRLPVVLPALSDAKASKSAQKEYEKGDSALVARNLDEARTHLEKAVSEYPCYARAQTELATVLAEKQKMVKAEAAARKARECDPDFIDAYLQLGMILINEKKFPESAAALQEGVRRAPTQWQFYYQLAAADYGQGLYSKADDDCQHVLLLNPTPPPEFHVRLADIYLKETQFGKAYAEMLVYLKAEPSGRFASKIKIIMQQMRAEGAVK